MQEPYGTLKRFRIPFGERVFSAFIVGHIEDGFDQPNYFEVDFRYSDGTPLHCAHLNRTVSGRHDGYPTLERAEKALAGYAKWLLEAEPQPVAA